MSVSTCLSGIVGLSANDCECFATSRPEDYAASSSGYYIDDPEYGFPLKIPQSMQECGESNLWNVLDRARAAGITQFITDFGANLLAGPYKKKIEPFNGWIGKATHSFNLTTTSTYAGIRICPYVFRGTMAKVFEIELYIQGRNGDTIAVGLYDLAALESGTPLTTVNVVISNNKGKTTLSTEYLYDFMDDYSQERDLWLLYQPGVGTPRNNTVRCATCGGKDLWQNYFAIGGVTGIDLVTISELTTQATYSYGLRVNLGVSCGHTWMCQNWDYDNDAWARVMAECIMLFGIRALAGIILKEPGPNRYTQVTREEVALHRDRVNTLLGQRMPWLAQNVPATATDCFICNNKITVSEYMV